MIGGVVVFGFVGRHGWVLGVIGERNLWCHHR